MIVSVGEDVNKLKPSYIADGNVKWHTHFGKQYISSLKKVTQLLYDPAISPQDI